MEVYLNPDAVEPAYEDWPYSNEYFINKYGMGPFVVEHAYEKVIW